jgi:hypothetical protein
MAYTTTPEDNETIANLPGDIRAVTAAVTAHTGAASGAHEAGAISYGDETVEEALNTAAGHEANQDNPHNVTAAQAGAVALNDAVATITADKVVRRNSNGKIAGDITGNANTATTATTAESLSTSGSTLTASWDGTKVTLQADSTADVPVHNSTLLQGMTPEQVVADTSAAYTASTQTTYTPNWSVSHSDPISISETQLTVQTGVVAGPYSLQAVIQKLIDLSHTHGTVSRSYWNCNCNCDCGGGE